VSRESIQAFSSLSVSTDLARVGFDSWNFIHENAFALLDHIQQLDG
jgi:hypothetical protein